MNTWDNIFEKAKEVTTAAGKKTGEIYEISRLKLSVMQTNNELKTVYEKLGNSVYTMVKADYENPDLVISIVGEIDELLEKLNKLNEKIAHLQKANICPKCGGKNPVSYTYCFTCGYKVAKDFYGAQANGFDFDAKAEHTNSEPEQEVIIAQVEPESETEDVKTKSEQEPAKDESDNK